MNNFKLFESKVGIGLSLLLYLTIAAAGVFFIQKFFSIDKPYVLTSNLFQDNLTFRSFNHVPLAIRISDDYGAPIASKGVFTPSFRWITTTKTNTSLLQKYEQITTSPCQANHFQNKYEEMISGFTGLDSYFCIDWNGIEVDMVNFYGGAISYSFGGFMITQCNTSDSSSGCLEQDKINKLFTNSYLDILTIDYGVSSTENIPVYPKINSYRTPITNQNYVRIWYSIAHGDYTSDSGIIFEDKKTISYYTLNVFKEDFRSIQSQHDVYNGSSEFIVVTFQNHEYKTFYLRSYVKIQEAFANFGGIVKGLMCVAQIIYFFIGRKDFWVEMAKMLPISIKSASVPPIKADVTSKSFTINKMIPLQKRVIQSFKTETDQPIKLTICERVLPFAIYKSASLGKLEDQIKILKNIFSAANIISLSSSVRNLKDMIFTDGEASLFNYLHDNNTETINYANVTSALSKNQREYTQKELKLVNQVKTVIQP